MSIKVCKNKFKDRLATLLTGLWYFWNLTLIPSIIYSVIIITDGKQMTEFEFVIIFNAIIGTTIFLSCVAVIDTVFHEIIRRQKLFEWNEDC